MWGGGGGYDEAYHTRHHRHSFLLRILHGILKGSGMYRPITMMISREDIYMAQTNSLQERGGYLFERHEDTNKCW